MRERELETGQIRRNPRWGVKVVYGQGRGAKLCMCSECGGNRSTGVGAVGECCSCSGGITRTWPAGAALQPAPRCGPGQPAEDRQAFHRKGGMPAMAVGLTNLYPPLRRRPRWGVNVRRAYGCAAWMAVETNGVRMTIVCQGEAHRHRVRALPVCRLARSTPWTDTCMVVLRRAHLRIMGRGLWGLPRGRAPRTLYQLLPPAALVGRLQTTGPQLVAPPYTLP